MSQHEMLNRTTVTSQELALLLQEREEGKVDFLLVDVREMMEYEGSHIKGVDVLKPTSTFQSWGQEFLDQNKEKTVIFTCRSGNRSGQVQNVFRQNGMVKAINHVGGIISYDAEQESGASF